MCTGSILHYLLQLIQETKGWLNAYMMPGQGRQKGKDKAPFSGPGQDHKRENMKHDTLQVKTCHVRPKEHPVNLDTISHSCIKFTSWMLSFIAMIVTVRVNFFFYSLRISYSTLSYSTVAQLLAGSSQITTQPSSSIFFKNKQKDH